MTKTYNYLLNGNPGSVEVTVNITACVQEFIGGTRDERRGYLDIQVTLSEALPFALALSFQVTNNFITPSGSGTSVYNINRFVPENVTSHVFTNLSCFEQYDNPFERYQLSYAFNDQPAVQEVGSSLAAQLIAVTDASCFGQANGTILVEASGGTGDYTYIWSDGGADSPFRPALAAGTYSVIVRDSNDDEVTIDNIIVGQPTQIQLATDITPVACFGGSNGAVNITPSGGEGPYTFSWSDGSSQQNRTGLSAGNYTVTVVDAAGCNRSFTINITQPAQIVITVNRAGKNVVNEITGGTTPYSFLWSDGIISKDRTNLDNGVYTFTVTDANGCQQSTIIVIQDFKFYFSKNPIWLELLAADPETKDNLSFVCEVFLEEEYLSDNFVKKYESEQPAKIDGSTDFNVEQVLNSFLDSKVPTFADAQIRRVGEAFKRFYLRYFEKFGTPPEPGTTIEQETFYVLFGGLSEQEFAKQTFFDSFLDNQKPFLTWQPKSISIGADQHAYLHFVINNPIYSSITMRVEIFYSDGDSSTTNLLTVSDVQPFEVFRFPTGITQLGLDQIDPTKQISKYSIQLVSGENELSEVRSYEVVKPRFYHKKLLFLNSIGGWDSLLCIGRGTKSLRTEEDSISRDLPVGYEYSDREVQTVSKTGMPQAKYFIGMLDGRSRAHLQDLAISEQVYEQTATGYLPVRVKFDFDPEDDFENLDQISLDIIYPKMRRYTPEL